MLTKATSRRPLLAALAAIAAMGAIDVGAFIATDPGTALKTGGRASGSLAGLAVWVLLLGVAGARLAREDRPALATATIGLGSLAALGGVGLAVVHQLAGVGGPRTVAGGLLGVAALGLALTLRGPAQD
ncbi:MAG: hypothetical protein QOK05_2750 [Chloroflexota bacterium]|jgi:hypothetical protein|nr:hypothetical protein [Chloroflexota bacterium]